jgi:spectinomycin phosphotransferase
MLEKPDLQDEKIVACLQAEYNLPIDQATFLPIGADRNTAVYRVVATDGKPYFLKLRRGRFDETSVALPKFLSGLGLAQIIAPLPAKSGQLWASLDNYKTILSPFIEGRNGYEVDLSDRHWVEFGATLKRIHAAELPPALTGRIRWENYAPQGRKIVRAYLRRAESEVFDNLLMADLATFLTDKRKELLNLVERAEQLAAVLQTQGREFVLCHSDLHAGNLLIEANQALYIVDWDEPILAPKERDLMYAGGAQGFRGHTPEQEEILFYQGYGQTQVDPIALSYYRYERIVQDIAVECDQIFSASGNGTDQEQAFEYLKSNFLPNNVIENARKTDKTRGFE